MRIVPRAEIGVKAWNAFCDSHPGAWWWWRNEWISYQLARGARDLSFGILDADRLVAICPLLLEERDGVRSFTMEGHPGPGPVVHSPGHDWAEIVAVAKDRVNALAAEYKASRVAYRWSPYSNDMPTVRGLARDISWHTQLLDLTSSEADLHASIRKSYTSLINHAARTHEIVVDPAGDLIPEFRKLHIAKCGRETRPVETWWMQRDWCTQGNGLIVAAFLGGAMVAATYWILYKDAGYFASSSSLHRSINHALIWRAMLECKKRGIQLLELGWQGYATDEKGKQIEFYKRGFGGYQVPVVAVERQWTARRCVASVSR